MTSASATPTKPRPSLAGLALTVLAAAALIISLAGATWFALVGKLDVNFRDLKGLTSLDSAPTFQHIYFGWLGWALAIVVIVALLIAVVIPVALVARAAQFLAIVLSLAGALLTLQAINELSNQDPGGSFGDHFGWLQLGGYLHVVGWVLAIIAAVVASRGRARAR